MDSDSESDDYLSENEENEDTFDEEAELMGYEEGTILEKLNTEKDNIERKNYLLGQKLKLVLQFNAELIDPDLYYFELNQINKQLNEIEAYSGSISNEFVQTEL